MDDTSQASAAWRDGLPDTVWRYIEREMRSLGVGTPKGSRVGVSEARELARFRQVDAYRIRRMRQIERLPTLENVRHACRILADAGIDDDSIERFIGAAVTASLFPYEQIRNAQRRAPEWRRETVETLQRLTALLDEGRELENDMGALPVDLVELQIRMNEQTAELAQRLEHWQPTPAPVLAPALKSRKGTLTVQFVQAFAARFKWKGTAYPRRFHEAVAAAGSALLQTDLPSESVRKALPPLS